MAKRQLPTPDELRQLLRYEPETGKLFWSERGLEWFKGSANFSPTVSAASWNKRYAGQEAFTRVCRNGYLNGTIFNAKFLAHRVAWAVFHGEWPANELDHIDGDKKGNRISNLRQATRSENMMNRGMSPHNTSGHKGVSFHRQRGLFRAGLVVMGKWKHLGSFKTAQEAAGAYQRGLVEYHGQFANAG